LNPRGKPRVDKTWKEKTEKIKINGKRIETHNGEDDMAKNEKHKGSGIRI